MTASDKRKAQLLVVLLAIGGLTYYFVYRGSPVKAPTAATKAAGGKSKKKGPVGDPQIRLDLVDSSAGLEDVGRKNLFQYGQPPPPARPVLPPPVVQAAPPPLAPANSSQRIVSVAPPGPPPMKPFKYEAYSVLGDPKTGRRMASISEGGSVYAMREGDCLMGQYCVRKITDVAVEIEDIFSRQRESFRRTIQ